MRQETSNEKVLLPVFREFQINDFHPFILYKFHKNYDGLIVADFLNKYGFNLDFKNQILTNEHSQIPFKYQKVSQKPSNIPIDLSHLESKIRSQLTKILQQNEEVLQLPRQPLNFSSSIKHKIRTIDETPIHCKIYRYPEIHKKEIENQINEMLEKQIIRPSNSPWSFPIVIVPKKQDLSGKTKWRIAIDYRKLNDKTIDDKYPLPHIDSILDKLGNKKYFTILDLASGFHQIELDEESIEKTAFTVDNGHYEFLRMPFGLKTAPATFQRLMNNILKYYLGKICYVYMDDVVIFSDTAEQHLADIHNVLEAFKKDNLKIQLDKCHFFQTEIEFLVHIITPEGIKPNPKKLKAITNFPIPKTQREIKSFLGLVGYYRKFIPNFSKISKPLTVCLKKEAKINIDDPKYIEAFQICKRNLLNDPILKYPDFEKPFVLTTDASGYAIGSILSQGNPPNDFPIAFASRTLNEAETRYSTIEKELLAIVWSCKYFRPYLFGRKFTIYTDHKPLCWLFSLKEPNSRLMRWRIKLEEFDYEIKYKKGSNINVDALSRIKIEDNNGQINAIEDDLLSIVNQVTTEELDECLNLLDSQKHDEIENQDENILDFQIEDITVHSAIENPIFELPITERSVNSAQLQIIIKIAPNYNVAKIKIFGDKFRLRVSINDIENDLFKFIKEYVQPKKSYTIYFASQELEKPLIRILQEKFDYKAFDIRISKLYLEDVEDKEEQLLRVQQFHETKTAHRGLRENLLSLKRKYYWPNMDKDVRNYINSCEICQKNKYERTPIQLQFKPNPTGSKPFTHIYCDTIKFNQTNCLSVIDSFSRLGQCYPLLQKTGTEILDKLLIFFSHYGVPNKMTCDNGVEFKNNAIQDFCKIHKIEIHYITNYNPNSNGIVERFHSTLIEQLRTITEKNLTFQNRLSQALLSYNNANHSSLDMTPMQIIKADLNYSLPVERTHNEEIQNYVEHYANNLKDISKHLEQNKKKNIERLEKTNEKRSAKTDHPLNENPTYIKCPITRKLDPIFKGIDATEIDNLHIRDNKNKHIYHKKILKQRKN
ncbi:hypothetical protein WA026_012743 [Henosepilachna vigintioctopunctata]|uniref:RNA-directed DNA polymerase n=1 Tax=Henosepilachna vigintioctopunctata TaxID=420089 RepID=A0AAW1U1P2_9CUCU